MNEIIRGILNIENIIIGIILLIIGSIKLISPEIINNNIVIIIGTVMIAIRLITNIISRESVDGEM